MATEIVKTRHLTKSTGLSSAQQLALLQLLSGASEATAGKVAGVSRQCVSGWVSRDPAFRTALRNAHHEIYQTFIKTLSDGLVGALQVVNDQIKSGNLKAAMFLLQAADIGNMAQECLSGLQAAPTDEETQKRAIQSEEEAEARWLKNQEARDRMSREIEERLYRN